MSARTIELLGLLKDKDIDPPDIEDIFSQIEVKDLILLKKHLDNAYFNESEPLVDDNSYNILVNTMEKMLEKEMKEETKKKLKKELGKVGATLKKGEKGVKLPFYLGSTDKITTKEKLDNWLKSNKSDKYIISDKLDGVSCLLTSKKGQLKLYTRGDGEKGTDISFLQKYIQGIPNLKGVDINVRGELIILKEVFKKKYKGEYANARNMVTGLISAKTERKGLWDIHLVVYEKVIDRGEAPTKQLKELSDYGFEVVYHELRKSLSIEDLAELYLDRKIASPYEIDGLIIQGNKPYIRNTSKNPGYMMAFKMLQEKNIHETKVIGIEWNVSQWGLLKPVAILEPVNVGDVIIRRATAHNARNVVENGIGVGAIIKVTRSKDVIPYIVGVKKKAKVVLPDGHWDKTHVNLVVNEMSSESCIKLLATFFQKMGIKHVAERTVKKMYENGLNNLLKIVGASKKRLAQVPGFEEKSVERIYENIRAGLQNMEPTKVLGSSGVFGQSIGRRRVKMILDAFPNLMELRDLPKNKLIKKLLSIEGVASATATLIANNIKYAHKLLVKLGKYGTYKKKLAKTSGIKRFSGQKIVFSGFRDVDWEGDIEKEGGKVQTGVSSNTTIVVYITPKNGIETSKMKKARKANEKGQNIKIFTRTEFAEKYKL